MNSGDALAGYLLVKKALDSVKRLPRLGRTADALRNDGEPADEEESEQFSQLATLVSALKSTAPFAVGGHIQVCESDLGASLAILNTPANQEVVLPGILESLEADALLPYCTRAKFGDATQRTNREDPNVRVAFEIASGAWDLRGYGLRGNGQAPPRFLAVIRDRVQAALVGESRDVELVPQKINVYEPGGFFAEHVDTPTDPLHMVGTVLVCLPCPHTGGSLVVKHNAAEEHFDFSEKSGLPGVVQWAAFFSDCLHEVQPVLSDRRVTITYSILARKAHSVSLSTAKCCAAEKLTHVAWSLEAQESLDEVVWCLENLCKQGQSAVGIYLSHMYTNQALNPTGLKGADRVLYTQLCKRWDVTLMHVLESIHDEGLNSEDGDHGYCDDDDHDFTYTNEVFSFTSIDLDAMARGCNSIAPHGLSNVPFVTPWDAKLVLQETTTRTRGGNQGNWYEAGTKEINSLYLHAALIVRLSN
jgi:hypothetical protein